MLIRVNFQFPDHSEVRYVDEVPLRGSSLRSHGSKWFVKDVNRDFGSYSNFGSYSVVLAAMTQGRPRIGSKSSLGGGIRVRRRFVPGRTGKHSG
jgi:hypothetical protein